MKRIRKIEADLQRLDFGRRTIILHHLAQYNKHHKKQRWDDACSQLRKALEQILFDIAKATAEIHSKGEIPQRKASIQNHEVLEYLKDKQFFNPYEVSLMNSLYGFLSDKSSHPGILKKEEAEDKINLTFQLLESTLRKYTAWIKNGYKFIPDSFPTFSYQVIDALKKSLLQKVTVSEHYIPTITLTPDNMSVAYKAKSKDALEKAPVLAKISVFAKAKDKMDRAIKGWESAEFDETELADVELFVGEKLVLPKEVGDKMKVIISPTMPPEKPMRIFIPETDIGFDYVFMRPVKVEQDVFYFNATTKDGIYNFRLGYPIKNVNKGSFGLTMDIDRANVCQFVKYENFLKSLCNRREIAIKSLELDKVIFKAQVNVEKDVLLSQQEFNLYEDLCFIQQKTDIEIKMPKIVTREDMGVIYRIKNILANQREEQIVNNMKFKFRKKEIVPLLDKFTGELSNISFSPQEIWYEKLFGLQIPLGRMEVKFKKSVFDKSIDQIRSELEQYNDDDLYELTIMPLPRNEKNAEFRYIK